MAKNVEVSRNSNESTANLIRRFTKRMQGSGVIPRVRSSRFLERVKSRNVRKTKRLKKLERKVDYDLQVKLGKVQESRWR